MGARRALDRGPRDCGPPVRRSLDRLVGAVPRIRRGEPCPDVCVRRRPSRPRLGQRSTGVDSRRHARPQLPAVGGRGARGTARGLRLPNPASRRSAQRDGVLQPRNPGTGRGPAVDAHRRGQSGRHVHRSASRTGGARSVLHAVARHDVRRRDGRLLQTHQSRLGAHSRLYRRGAPVTAVHGSRPPGRSRRRRLPSPAA